ncbi:MAG: zinc ribbon domain-containing protein, partial [candidate division Zixibacteria bacterium]|nr:zinc ribbon domain-containing protein [candidate division Zixibacteria bacterium]
QTTAIPSASSAGFRINWALAAIVTGSLIIIAALIWQFASRRPSPDIRTQNDSRALRQSRAGFCRDCGEPVEEGDRFCSACGSEL